MRGLAILLVLCFHLLWANNHTGSAFVDFLGRLRSAGWVGVDLFFALSGFLITGILFDTRRQRHYFRNFYLRRVLRIFPLYYGVLLVLFLIFRPHNPVAERPFLLLLGYLQNTPLWWHPPQHGAVIDLTLHLWSLAAEEQFYFVWPLLVFLLPSRRALLWTALGLAALAPVVRYVLLSHGASIQETYKLTLCRADSLLGGAWLALAVRGRARNLVLRAAPAVFCVAVLVCVAIAFHEGSFDYEHSRNINLYAYSVLAVASASLVAMALRPALWVAGALRTRPLRWLGRYSYGIYVFHQMIAVGVTMLAEPFLQAHLHSKIVYHLCFFAIVLAITFPLAYLSFRFFEAPFLGLKAFFPTRPAVPPALRDSGVAVDAPGVTGTGP